MVTDELPWLTEIAQADFDVAAMLVFGSVARGDHHGRSDLDAAIVACPGRATDVASRVAAACRVRFPHQLPFADRGKLALYSADARRKIDLFVIEDPADIAHLVAGSRLPDPRRAAIFDRTGVLGAFLDQLTPEVDDRAGAIDAQCARFAYHLEQASGCHARGDAYRSHFNLEVALASLAALEWRAAGQSAFAWLPKDLYRLAAPEVAARLSEFQAPMRLAGMAQACSALVAMFQDVLRRLDHDAPAAVRLCELAVERDAFWNFRDSADYVDSGLRPGVLFRGSAPVAARGGGALAEWLRQRRITRRVDLRLAAERERHPVELDGITAIEVEMPVPEARALSHEASRDETIYRHMAFHCGAVLSAIVQAVVADEGAVLVHCHAGVDRTGIAVALAQMLVGVPLEAVLAGYTASSGAKPAPMVARVLRSIEAEGGASAVLASAVPERASDLIDAFRARMMP